MLRLAGRILAKSHSNKLAADTCTVGARRHVRCRRSTASWSTVRKAVGH